MLKIPGRTWVFVMEGVLSCGSVMVAILDATDATMNVGQFDRTVICLRRSEGT